MAYLFNGTPKGSQKRVHLGTPISWKGVSVWKKGGPKWTPGERLTRGREHRQTCECCIFSLIGGSGAGPQEGLPWGTPFDEPDEEKVKYGSPISPSLGDPNG